MIGFASSVYIFRWLFLPLKRASAPTRDINSNFSFIPVQMLLPIYMLAVLAVAGSLAYFYLPGYLSSYGSMANALAPGSFAAETVAVVLGLALAYVVYFRRNGKKPAVTHRFAYAALYNNLFVNAFYAAVARSFLTISSIADLLDYELYRFVRALARSVLGFAEMLRRVENGQVNAYMLVFILGILAMIVFFAVVMP